MLKAKLLLFGVIALLVILIGIPALQNIGDGYQKDYANLLNPDQVMNLNINPNTSSIQTIVGLTPNGTKAIGQEMNGFSNFLDGVMKFFLVVLVFVGVLMYMHFRGKAKEEKEFQARYGSRYGNRYKR